MLYVINAYGLTFLLFSGLFFWLHRQFRIAKRESKRLNAD